MITFVRINYTLSAGMYLSRTEELKLRKTTKPDMKRFLLAIAALAMAFVGCTTDAASNSPIDAIGTTELTISTPSTRTSLGEKVGDTYPVYWSEGDKIWANGVMSNEAEISTTNPSSAKFTFDNIINYPLNIIYPCTSSTEPSKVVVPSEQDYTEGTFAAGSAPMCGYATNSTSIALKHLVGILKFPVVAHKEGVVLDRIVIRSNNGAKLSGEFEVDCSGGKMVASEGASNTITYSLPDNFVLSTTKASTFHISVAAGNVGKCNIEFIEASGKKMAAAWNGDNLSAGIVREFKTITYKQGWSGALEPMQVEEDTIIVFYPTVYGYVKEANGKPIANVAVSDGFSVTKTDSNGYYEFENMTKDCRYIYISLPAEYEVPINEFGQPCFYKPYPSNSPQYDFTLTPLASGKEKKFALFTFADPQVSKASTLSRLNTEAIPEIYAHGQELAAKGINCYGITLGDIISNSDTNNTGAYRDDMRDAFAYSKTGMPVFQVMGNHDNTFCSSTQPIFPDERSSHFQLKAQREHEDMFGPVNYSFNRGDVHIIGMRDIVYSSNSKGSGYSTGFLPSQVEWLKQDLALVPKDKMVVLCVHIQLFNGTSNSTQEVLSLLDQYKEAHILSGHIHRQQLYEPAERGSTHKAYEHNTNAVCGSWWSANISGDGTPNGYNVFVGEGNTFSDWYYMGYNKGINARSHQMRLYRGNAVTGGEISGTNTYGVKGYYGFNFADNVLLANVYNADSKWKIEVYEDGVYSGQMTKVAESQPSFSALTGDYTLTSPRRAKSGVVASTDFYATGLHIGVLGRVSSATEPSNGAYNICWHMFQYKLKNKDAKIKVVATDRFGNKYTETVITEGTDYTLVKKPQ